MKFIGRISLLLALMFTSSIEAQNESSIEVGEVLEIGVSENHQYSNVDFPKPNFIIKTGGIANYKKLSGTLVEVTQVKTNNNGETIVHFKRKDGQKFFGSFAEVKANYDLAIASKELVKIKA